MRITLVTAADENYAMALAVMVRSALESLREDAAVDLYVLGDGLAPETRARLESSWSPFRIQTFWIAPDSAILAGNVYLGGHAGVPATYFRLLLSEYLPAMVEKAIYLDADMVVTGDLGDLLEIDLGDAVVGAVHDAYTDYFHRRRLESADLPGELRARPLVDYFNAGLMVVQLQRWRDRRIGCRALELVREYGTQLVFHDQDALNLVLAGRWRPLDPTWNFHELPQFLSAWEAARYTDRQLRELLCKPRIVHFVSSEKPWKFAYYESRYADLFYEVLSRTKWSDWAPPKVPRAAKVLKEYLVQPVLRAHWCLWRGLIHTFSLDQLLVLAKIIVRYPWTVIVYPAWVFLSGRPPVRQ